MYLVKQAGDRGAVFSWDWFGDLGIGVEAQGPHGSWDKVREKETRRECREEAVGQGARIWDLGSLDRNRAERERHLIGLVSVLLAVAVGSVARGLLLLGQLGL